MLIGMRVKVLLFGQLKDIVGRQEELLNLEPETRLSAVMPRRSTAVATRLPMPSWVTTTPLERPVEPEV